MRCVSQPAVKILTEADIAAGTYTIFDVLMPLFGYGVTYPTHAAGKSRVEQLLGEHGINMEDHLRQPKHKLYALAGAYRRVVGRAGGVDWSLKQYTSPEVTWAERCSLCCYVLFTLLT